MKRAKTKPKPAAPEAMNGERLQIAIDKIGISQRGLSRLIGVGERTVRSWIADVYPVPRGVAMLLNLMVKTKTKPDDLAA
jgi:DNA-binding transcriptional regulator YiaG